MRATASSPTSALVHSLEAIRRHKKAALLVFVITVASVSAVTWALPRKYRSEAELFLRLGRENAMLDPTVMLGQEPVLGIPFSRDNEINSVAEILQNRTVLERVLAAVGAAAILGSENSTGAKGGQAVPADPAGEVHDRAIRQLTTDLNVTPVRKSNVIQVSYVARTPELAQKVLATLIDAYMDEHIRLNRPPQAHEFLLQQTRLMRTELTRKEESLRDLKTATGLTSPLDQRQALVKRISRLEDDLLDAETTRVAARSRVEALREQAAALPATRLASSTAGVGDEGTDRMREQLYILQLKKEEMATKYTAIHPAMQQIEQQLAAAQAIVDRQGGTRTHATTAPNPLFEETQLSLLREEPLLAATQAKAAAVRAQLAALRDQQKRFNENELRVAQLENEVELLQANYRKHTISLEQARVDHALEVQRMSNISVVHPATLERRPVSPQVALNLALGVLLGGLGGLGLALARGRLDHRLRTALDIEDKLELPVLGCVPVLPARQPVLDGNGRS